MPVRCIDPQCRIDGSGFGALPRIARLFVRDKRPGMPRAVSPVCYEHAYSAEWMEEIPYGEGLRLWTVQNVHES